MNQRFRDYLAAAVGVVALTLGSLALVLGLVDFGVTFRQEGDRLLIDRVATNSPASFEGFQPGMVVLSLNYQQLLRLPEPVCPEEGCSDPPTIFDPPVPTAVPLDNGLLSQLLYAQVTDLTAMSAENLANYDPAAGYGFGFVGTSRYYAEDLRSSAFGLLAGVLLMVVGAWWLGTGRGGESLKSVAIPLAVAIAVPLVAAPLRATWFGPAVVAAGVLVPLGFAVLGLALAARIDELEIRGVARTVAVGSAFGAMLIGVSRMAMPSPNGSVDLVWGALVAATVLIPGLAAAGPLRQPAATAGQSGRRLLQSTEMAVAGVAPVMSLLTNPRDPLLFPLSFWLGSIAIAGILGIRPLARLAMRAQLQRDLIVAATEAERARVAADIHDDALQELTLLVHRLDEAGDEEGAGIARTVSDRLRAICGDLRLPILDDLGVGPALDWLVLRIERLSGGEVRLERADGTRPPADVELAFFRIAQEALGNAVKHGAPPIVVRYRATDVGASLSVDDAGPGILPDAAETAEREGRFGLTNMQQRAEAIGAILDIRRWPGGGTHVALEWRPS